MSPVLIVACIAAVTVVAFASIVAQSFTRRF